ncbi:carbohydrate ABC transporter permease [Halocella sp. SP3-1]|uniref:carbohydrate ABC transporter permease n=1 Tax=Halocella sp. SP3-1 TaxID=2382161 RepID=UPI000F760B69|nr:carbohydrate ABC transporter permease [Halocella sp. SP3-1]AZO93639.1 carbohydrate ABC transporter permease [Halocella sp. SP3-1]
MHTLKNNSKFTFKKTLILIFLSILVLITLLPMFWVVISSLKSNADFFSSPLNFPQKLLFKNYVTAWQRGLSQYFLNSIIVTTISVFLTVFIAASCSYALTRFNFKGKKIIFYTILAGLLLSPQVALLPLYQLLNNLNIYNTYLALILPYVGFQLPFVVFLMRAYFLSFPKEIEESAYLDGCNTFSVFFRIVLPISKPIIATAVIVSSRLIWNEFLFGLVFIDDKSLMTIPVGLTNFQSALQTDYSSLMAGIVIAAIPMVVIFLLLQKYFVRGLTAGSVKG